MTAATRPHLAADGAGLAGLVGGRAVVAGRMAVRGAAVDSRLVSERQGCIFFALPGERTDGRLHAAAALEAGAAAVIYAPGGGASIDAAIGAAAAVAMSRGASLVEVADPLAALATAARAWRATLEIEVIGITGSVGKTSTKELTIAALGGERAHCAATPGNANNEIGLPLALLNLPDDTERFVAEMGMYVPGDIASLCAIARPSIGVVTAVDAVHASRAGGLDAIEQGKGELVAALPADGWAILAVDDPRVARMAARGPARVLTAGAAAGSDIRILGARLDETRARTIVRLATPEGEIEVSLPAFGLHFARAAALALATARACGVPLQLAARQMEAATLPAGRASIHAAGGVRIIDDAYNAAPTSMAAALATLGACAGRRFAALGPMGELGDLAEAAHLEIGRAAAETGLELLVVLGADADGIAEGARLAGMPIERILRLPGDEAGLDAAAGMLGDRARSGDTILVKASRASQLERLVSRLLARFGAAA